MEKTLLLVDDEDNIIRALRRLFRQEPFNLLTASSGEEGLQILAQKPVAVILSDQRMPGMNGADFLKIAKELYPNTIRLVMSGYTELESITSAINDGAVFKFLLKPWDDEKLLGHIRDAFSYHNLKANNQRLSDELRQLNENLEERIREEREKNTINTHSLLLSQELLDHAPIAIFGVSDEGLIVLANQYAHKLANQEALIGNMIDDVFSEPIYRALYQALVNVADIPADMNWPETRQPIKITPIQYADIHCLCVSVG